MGISKRNGEGYKDLTAYEALSNIERDGICSKSRPLVYISSPYSGDVERNTEQAGKYSRFAVFKGFTPVTPHLLFPRFMDDDDPAERELSLFMALTLLSKCSELWVFGDTVSKGMKLEIDRAERLHMRIRFFTEAMKEMKKSAGRT